MPPTTAPPVPTQNNGRNLAELEDTVSRLCTHKGVEAVMIMTREGGKVIQSTLPDDRTVEQAAIVARMLQNSTQLLDAIEQQQPTPDTDTDTAASSLAAPGIDEITFLRLRSRKREIMIAPDKEYLLVVFQTPTSVE